MMHDQKQDTTPIRHLRDTNKVDTTMHRWQELNNNGHIDMAPPHHAAINAVSHQRRNATNTTMIRLCSVALKWLRQNNNANKTQQQYTLDAMQHSTNERILLSLSPSAIQIRYQPHTNEFNFHYS